MKISQKARYAVAALLDLALHTPPAGGVRSGEVARRTGVPARFVETILRDLRLAGLVTSRRGPGGGHRLARDPARLTVAAVIAAIDGQACAGSARGCRIADPTDACLRDLWDGIAAAARDAAEGTTIEELRRRADLPAAVDFVI